MTRKEVMLQVLLVCSQSQDKFPSVGEIASRIPDADGDDVVEECVNHAFRQGWLSATDSPPSMMDEGGEVVLSEIGGLTLAGRDALNKLRRGRT